MVFAFFCALSAISGFTIFYRADRWNRSLDQGMKFPEHVRAKHMAVGRYLLIVFIISTLAALYLGR